MIGQLQMHPVQTRVMPAGHVDPIPTGKMNVPKTTCPSTKDHPDRISNADVDPLDHPHPNNSLDNPDPSSNIRKTTKPQFMEGSQIWENQQTQEKKL